MQDKPIGSGDFTPQELVKAFTTVCKQAIRSTGGSEIWDGETKEFLQNMENLVSYVEGKPFQPKSLDALDDMKIIKEIAERFCDKVKVEFSSVAAGLAATDNPLSHGEYIQDCADDCMSTVRGLREQLKPERPILDENYQHRQTGRDLGL